MRFYTKQHKYYCGIDLHTKKMYVCILDGTGETVIHQNIRTDPEAFLSVIAAYREDIVVAVECMFTWYWIADLCANEGIPFVLGHALYMKAIRGGKSKNDKIDSHKIAVLLRGGMLPQSYVYLARMRAARGPLETAQSPREKARRAPRPHPKHPSPIQPRGSPGTDRKTQEPARGGGTLRQSLCAEKHSRQPRDHFSLRPDS
jgi:hypothetical protein